MIGVAPESVDRARSGLTDVPDRLQGLVTTPLTYAMFAIFALLPMMLSPSDQALVTSMMIFGLFALGFDFLYGYGGIVSFGHAVFWGLGAYTIALLSVYYGVTSFWLLFPMAIIVPAVFSVLVGIVSIRLTGTYFAILTLAWAEIVAILFRNLDVTGGFNGFGFAPPQIVIPGIVEFGVLDVTPFYYLVFAALILTYLVLRRMTKSYVGAVLKGVRENQQRIQYLGYNEKWYRIFALTVSAGVGGMAGAFQASVASFVGPSFMNFIISGEVIVWTVIGGKGTLVGPIIGGALVRFLEDFLAGQVTWWFIPIGVFFIVVMIFFPDGIVGALKRLREWI